METSTSGLVYCPDCLTYYNPEVYHVCNKSYSGGTWKICENCQMYYMVERGEHICPIDNQILDKLKNVEQMLQEILGLLKDK